MSLLRRPINLPFAIGRRAPGRGFTLVEMMVAIAILAILSLILVAITDNAARLWDRGESQNQYRVRTRALLDYMGRELRVATLAMNQGTVAASTSPTLQLLIDPPVGSDCKYPDTIFWQAPIASDDHSLGDLAEIGYFVRWGADNHANLCRYFVNPTTGVTGTSNPNYLIYSATPGTWVFGGTANPPNSSTGAAGNLDTVAPANALNNYQGLFLENVLGLWVQAYDIKGNLLANPYDSSNPPLSTPLHALPPYVVLSIVMLSNAGANRLAANASAITAIKNLYIKPDGSSFLAAMRAPGSGIPVTISSGASIASIQVSLDNYK